MINKTYGRIALLVLLLFSFKLAHSEERKNFKPGYSISLTGGGGIIAIGDINRVLRSINNNDEFKYTRKHSPDFLIGRLKRLNPWKADWEAEVIADITPNFSMGISTASALHRKNESSITYIDRGGAGDQITTLTFKPEVKVTRPVKFSMYYTWPYRSNINIYCSVGVGFYSGEMAEYKKFEITAPSGGYEWITRYWETDNKASFGFHSGVGIEYLVTRRVALIMEIQGRYGRIRNFKGTTQFEHIDFGIYPEESGFLYYYTKWDFRIGARYADLEIWEKPPEGSIWDIADVRKAVLSLKGLFLRVGIRLKLF